MPFDLPVKVMETTEGGQTVVAPQAPATPQADKGTASGRLFISVVVPVRNEARFIERTLERLLTQYYDPACFEVLVIDGESNDGTPAIVERLSAKHANLRLLHNPRRLSSAARNIGIRNARGDVLLVVDGHCEVRAREHLARLADAFQRSGADAVGRPQPLDTAGATSLQRAIAVVRASRLGHHPDSLIYSNREGFVPARSVAVAYRRTVFERIGCFDEAFDACEDVELNHRLDRAGLTCFFTPAVAIHYVPRTTLRGLFRQLVRYGRGRLQLLRKHPETFSVLPLVPGMFVAGVFLGPLAALVWPPLGIVYLSVLLIYALIVLAFSAANSRRIGIRERILLPPVFATVHLGSGVGQLWELVCPTRLSAAPPEKVDA
jgi:succinoglycan biosynthesis protein ExoA